MNPPPPVSTDSIDHLCALADLPLSAARRRALAPMLAELVAAANELSRTMAQACHRDVLPVVRFPERDGAAS
jgi:hypothetical protein